MTSTHGVLSLLWRTLHFAFNSGIPVAGLINGYHQRRVYLTSILDKPTITGKDHFVGNGRECWKLLALSF